MSRDRAIRVRGFTRPAEDCSTVSGSRMSVRRFFLGKMPALAEAGIKPIVSLAAEDWDGYRKLLDATAAAEGVDIIELNLSCPNVERGGMAVGTNPELLAKYVRRAKDILPEMMVLAKLTPNVSDIRHWPSSLKRQEPTV